MVEKISIIVSACTLIGMIVVVYRSWADPNSRQDKTIGKIETACKLKHEKVDHDFSLFGKELSLIRENHLTHIERRVDEIEKSQVRILTILEERLPNKKL